MEFLGCLLNQLQNKFVFGGIRRKINVFLVRINSTQGLTTLHQCTVNCTVYIVQPQNGRKEEDLPPAIQSIIFHIFEKGGGQADR